MSLIVRHPPGREAERAYALHLVLGEFLGLEFTTQLHALPEVHILLANEPRGRFVRVIDAFLSQPERTWLTSESLPRLPLPTCDVPAEWDPSSRLASRRLPVLFGSPGPPLRNGRYLDESCRDISIGIDVFGSAFFMLTRYEELCSGAPRDAHDRFPASASVASRGGFLERPLIDEYVAILGRSLHGLHTDLYTAPRDGALRLSHDVDRPRMHDADATWPRVIGCAWRELRAGSPQRGLTRVTSFNQRAQRDPYDTFAFLLDESDRVGATSTFNIMTGCSDARFDPGYDTATPYFRQLLRTIDQRGHRVGFHPSYATSTDLALARSEYHALRHLLHEEGIDHGPLGGRQHFLRWNNPTTWRNWSAIGADHDASLGFAEHVGFRCGTARPYGVFDLEARAPLPLREHPLIAMDTTMLDYMGLTPGEARDRVATLSRTCRRLGGDFTLLVHNSTLYTPARHRWYSDLLDAAAKATDGARTA